MKIKYIFDNIHTNADTITVSSGTEDIIILNKADFNNDWKTALNQEYYIDEVQCNDLSNLKITGAEAHSATYTEELNTKWKEFTKNKLGSKHINDPLVINSLDKELPVQVYNQTSITTRDDIYGICYNTHSKLGGDYQYDFSHLIINLSKEYLSVNTYITPCSYYSGSYNTVFGSVSSDPTTIGLNKITKWFDLPEGLSSLPYGFAFTSIENLPVIPSSVTSIYGICFYSKIKKIYNLDYPNILNVDYAFAKCTELEEVGDINLPNAVNTNKCFESCTKLKKVGNINIKGDVGTSTVFYDCSSLREVGNVIATGQVYFSKLSKIGDIIGQSVALGSAPDGELLAGNILSCTRFSGDTGSIVSVKVVNLPERTNSQGNIYFWPKSCVALPVYFGNYNKYQMSAAPSSTGFDIWVDYVDTTLTTTYKEGHVVKNITNSTYTISEDLSTLNTKETVYLKNFNILEKNGEYQHTFVVKNCELDNYISNKAFAGSNIDLSDTTALLNSIIVHADGTIDVDIPCINIADNSVSSGKITIPVKYVAEIDGVEFHGATIATINFNYTWQIDEDVNIQCMLVNDDGSDPDAPVEDNIEDVDTSDEVVEPADTEESEDSSENDSEEQAAEETPVEE